MDLYIMDRQFKIIGIIDEYVSIIWTRRYFESGDFELYLPANTELLKILKCNNYLYRKDSESIMIIESIKITTDAEQGDFFTVSGRSAESILARRIFPNSQHGGNGSDTIVASIIFNMIEDQCEQGRAEDERVIKEIKSYTFSQMRNFSEDTFYAVSRGDNLYDKTVEYCKMFGIGFKIFFREDLQGLELNFYEGKSRTHLQTTNTYVIFSKSYDNILSSEYLIDYTNYTNTAFVNGDESENRTTWTSKDDKYFAGIDRYETYVDAKDLKKEDVEYDRYWNVLATKGKEKIATMQAVEGFNAELETSLQFEYTKDWDLGDIVEIETEYGINAHARIIEVIECDDETGYKVAPTLSAWEVIG